jgi:hypothetical protein
MRLRLTRGHMKTIVWIVASLFVWLVFSTAGCGGVECAPYVAVGYAPFWIPMLVYGAVSEWISRRFAGRWAAPCFVTLMAAGTIVLLCALVIYYPAIFNEAAAFDVPLVLILPTTAITVLYLVKIVRWTRLDQEREVAAPDPKSAGSPARESPARSPGTTAA